MTPTRIIYALAGAPPLDACLDLGGICSICAQSMARGQRFDRWVGSQFTDQNKLRHVGSDRICEPCMWGHSWVAPPGMVSDPSKKKGLSLRMFSHFWSEGDGYHAWNKANKREIRDWLREPKRGKWFAAISDTGQKHLLPRTPLNLGECGSVRFEEQTILLRPTIWPMVDRATVLLSSRKVTKDEIATGDYRATSFVAGALEFERDHGRERGGALFALALWLAQREEVEDGDGQSERGDSLAHHGDALGVPSGRGVATQALGSVAGSDAGGGTPKRKRSAVRDVDVAVAEPRSPEQRSLFGD